MASGGWRAAAGALVLAAAVGGLAGCSTGSGGPAGAAATAKGATAKAAAAEGITAARLKSALLTHVNGVGSAAAATSGRYASVSQAVLGQPAAGGVQVTPKACTAAVSAGFGPAGLAGDPAAAVTFRVGTNGVSEVLVSSSAKSASAALAGHVPAGCARYQEKAGGKTVTYGVKEQPVTGIGPQAEVLNVQAMGTTSASKAASQWSLSYRGTGFLGTVTVTGPNASEKAVQELAEQAYAFAAKTLS